MRYTITSQQFDHLRKEGSCDFAGMYSEEKIQVLKELLQKAAPQTGRDLERANPPLFKTLNPSMLGQIASELYRKKQIRIAFTQVLPSFTELASLEEIASVSEVFGGCILDLESGDVTFYMPQTPIDFPHLEGEKLLIAFTTEKGRYIIQERDPQTHSLKKLGYGAGDRLTDATHPLIHK